MTQSPYEPVSPTPGDQSNLSGASMDNLTQTVSDAADRLSDTMDRVMSQRDVWMESARTQVRAKPMAAVAVAFVAGMLFSHLTRD